MVQLGLGSAHLGVGCNFVAIKVRLEFQNIFGPSTLDQTPISKSLYEGASLRLSFGPHSAWVRIESTTILLDLYTFRFWPKETGSF